MTGGDLNPGYFIDPPFLTYILAAWLSIVHLGGLSSGSPTMRARCSSPGAGSRVLRGRDGRGDVLAGGRGSTSGSGWSPRRSSRSRSCPSSTRGWRSTTGLGCCRARWRCGPRRSCCDGLHARAARRRCGRRPRGDLQVLRRGGGDRARRRRVLRLAHFKGAVGGPGVRALIAIAAVIVTNPYLFADWDTFIHDLDRQRKFAGGAAAARPARTQRLVVLRDVAAWALGVIPGVLALAGGILLLVSRRREAVVLGALVVLYWLYMGSQSRFYARWMLPLYPALAILAAYARDADQAARRVRGRRRAGADPVAAHDRPQRGRARPRGHALPDPRLARGERPAGHEGRVRADRADRVVRRHTRRRAEGGPRAASGSASTAARRSSTNSRATSAARATPRTSRTTSARSRPELIDVYRREGVCWVVTGSTQYGRAQAES